MASEDKRRVKIVARLRNGQTVKGFLDPVPVPDLETLFQDAAFPLPGEICVQTVESGETRILSLASLKALFFVKSFDGKKDYREVKFFEKTPPIKGLWVCARFYDNEYLEGVVRNSIDYLIEPGFFLKPPDPHSNNEILYIVKNSLIDFRVLGVRMDY